MSNQGWTVEDAQPSKFNNNKNKGKKQLKNKLNSKPKTFDKSKPADKLKGKKSKKIQLFSGNSDDEEEELIRRKSEVIKFNKDQLLNVANYDTIDGDEDNTATTDNTGNKLTKSQKRKQNKKNKKNVVSDEEWMKLSTSAPPPMPKMKNILGKEINWESVESNELVDDGLEDGLEGFLGLEVADGIDCNWEEIDGAGKMLKFTSVGNIKKRKLDDNLDDTYALPLDEDEMKGFIHIDDFKEDGVENSDEEESEEEGDEDEDEDIEDEEEDIEAEANEKDEDDEDDEDEDEVPTLVDIPEEELEEIKDKLGDWIHYELHDNIMKGLYESKFFTPTQVQKDTLLKSLQQKRDIVASAETGSGKTLAFGLPILQRITEVDLTDAESKKVYGLILAPTRELALQITQHLKQMGKYIPKFYCGTIVGGLSAQKQNRVLRKVPHILVATPGRLWDLVSTNSDYLKLIRQVEFLVFDEADRMLQTGRFKEVQQLLPVLDKHMDNMPKPASRQTFIFSATLPPSLKTEPAKSKKDKKPKEVGIQELLKSIKFRDSKPFYLNLTKEDQGLASKLVESRIDCLLADKFLYLYYLLLRYPGRTICFVNSIDTIRRLIPQLELLGIKAYPLHAEMQQKQRLKNVDRFKTLDNVVLVASDVAARGLDIPLVDHVIHYQLPRTVDLYIHRSGRTARGSQSGISIMLTCPEELKSYTMICRHLEKERVDHFNIDNLLVKKLKPRVTLAQEIDKLMHSGRKEKANRNWIEQQAEKLDIILDEDFIGKVKKSEDHQEVQATTQRKIHKLKEQLNKMLNDKIIQVGHSTKYLTKFYGSNSDLLQNLKQQKTEAFDANEKRSAITDAKKRKLKK